MFDMPLDPNKQTDKHIHTLLESCTYDYRTLLLNDVTE